MSKPEIVFIYHEDCQPSLKLLKLLESNKEYTSSVELINLKKDQIESSIDVKVVPMLVIDNENVYEGKLAFDFINKLSENKLQEQKNKKKKMYSNLFVAPPDPESSKKKSVTFD